MIGEMVLSWRFAYIWLPQVAQEMFAGTVRLTETTSKLWPRLAAKLIPPQSLCLLTPLIESVWSAASCSVAINKKEFELFLISNKNCWDYREMIHMESCFFFLKLSQTVTSKTSENRVACYAPFLN